MPSSTADRNLLFGILALQMDFISRDALIAAMNAWVLNKERTLGDILREQKTLAEADCAALELLVQRHLCRHGGDVNRSLAAVQASTPLREPLQQIADTDVQASVAHLACTPERAADPESTTAYSPTPAGERFVILRPHARGGLGQVNVALDQELHRQVALKEMLDGEAHDPAKRSRFVREAEITGGLEHPGIVPVYGLGAYTDGRPYYAMRFIKGDSLQQAIKQFHDKSEAHRDASARALALRQLLGRFVDVCNAIAYAHSRGVLHRDLKPDNIMLGPYGETLVVDWGLAKPLGTAAEQPGASSEPLLRPVSDSDLAATLAGSTVGTPAYMSPEQAAGRLDRLSPASDVYSLGATLYCLLTGQAPFDSGNLPDVLQAVQKGQSAPVETVKPGVPLALAAICRKAMALEPAERYPSARALADDVEHWLADEPVAAHAEPLRQRAGRWVRRHKAMVVSAAAAAAVLLAAGVAWWLVAAARGRADEQERVATTMKGLRDRAQELEALTRHYRYDAEMDVAQQAYEGADMARLLEQLNEQRPEHTGGEDFRGFEWYYLWRLAHQDPLTLKGHEAAVRSVAFSPDGRRLATASEDKTAKLWDAQTGRELCTLKGHQGRVWSVAFSPDGRRLATASEDKTAKLWDAQTGRELCTLKGHQSGVFSVAFSPDGRHLATASSDETAKLWDAQTGREVLTLKGHQGLVYSVAFSPDGRRLATASQDKTAKLWDAQTGRELLTVQGHRGRVYSVAFSPDGRRLATASSDETAKLWDAQTARELLTLNGGQSDVFSVAFSPDGRRLATASSDKTTTVWDAHTGWKILTLKGHQGLVYSVAFSPDGRRLATASLDKTAKLWDAETGREFLTLNGRWGIVWSVAFSPDGRRLATASSDETAKLWNVQTGRQLLTLKGHEAPVRSVAFSPDGRRLATASDDKTAKLWDAQTGRELFTLKGHQGRVWSVAFSPDGHRLATASSDETAKLWDAETGRELLTLKGRWGRVWSVAFSPDGRRLATALEDKTAKLWDAETGRELLTLKGHEAAVRSVAFSPDGRRLATASQDKTAKLWDAQTGRELFTLKGHEAAVRSMAFSPDGRRLATASLDTVKLWDTETGRDVLTLTWAGRAIYSVAFSPDGRRLAASAEDNIVRSWYTVPLTSAERAEVEAVELVDSLFTELRLRAAVLNRLRHDTGLTEPRRQRALAVAESCSDNPQALNGASWGVVRRSDASPDEYRQALRLAEAATRLAPAEGNILNTLGVALYRAGRYADALQTLTRSEALNRASPVGELPEDLAFLAMAHFRLGHQEQAQAYLARLRKLSQGPRWANNQEAQGFLQEAAELLRGSATHRHKPKRESGHVALRSRATDFRARRGS